MRQASLSAVSRFARSKHLQDQARNLWWHLSGLPAVAAVVNAMTGRRPAEQLPTVGPVFDGQALLGLANLPHREPCISFRREPTYLPVGPMVRSMPA